MIKQILGDTGKRKDNIFAVCKTGGLSVLHFLVDGVCAVYMFSTFIPTENGYKYILVYNFCAFVLQLPFGMLLDALNRKEKFGGYADYACIILSLAVTGFGFVHPAVLGVGNALFHTGAGVRVMELDDYYGWKGRGLGTFVAPGALGLFFGTAIGNSPAAVSAVNVIDILFLTSGIVFLVWKIKELLEKSGKSFSGKHGKKHCGGERTVYSKPRKSSAAAAAVCLVCFMVVILRSYVGFAVSFEWKQGFACGLAAVLAVVLGKAAGGFLSARFGIVNTVCVSLLLSAIFYCFGQNMFFGVSALFLFNMTMPVTLFMIADALKGRPGLSFGLLTTALFAGFFPVWLNISLPFYIPSEMTGALGSAVSLVCLSTVGRMCGKDK